MASICMWAKSKVTGNVVHVSDVPGLVSKDDVICAECGERLVKCSGAKKSAYFRHLANSVNRNCKGGTGETIIHEMAKQVITNKFEIPKDFVSFPRNNEVIYSNDIFKLFGFNKHIEHTIKITDKTFIRPDIYLENDNLDVYIEIFVTNRVSEDKKSKYYRYLLNRKDEKPWVVVEIDLSDLQKRINTVTPAELTELVVEDSTCKRVIASEFKWKIDKLLKDSYYETSGDIAVCPADNLYVNMCSIESCKTCPYIIGVDSNGVMRCMGRSCYSTAKDVLTDLLNKTDKSSRLDIYGLPEGVYRTQRYQSLKNRLGTCSCGTGYILAQAPDRDRFSYLSGSKDSLVKAEEAIKEDFVYRVCPRCGNLEMVRCPKCGEPMKLLRNSKTGVVFLACNHIKSRGTSSNDNTCSASLAVFADDTCKDMHWDKELLWWGSLDNYLNIDTYQRYVDLFYDTRRLWI